MKTIVIAAFVLQTANFVFGAQSNLPAINGFTFTEITSRRSDFIEQKESELDRQAHQELTSQTQKDCADILGSRSNYKLLFWEKKVLPGILGQIFNYYLTYSCEALGPREEVIRKLADFLKTHELIAKKGLVDLGPEVIREVIRIGNLKDERFFPAIKVLVELGPSHKDSNGFFIETLKGEISELQRNFLYRQLQTHLARDFKDDFPDDEIVHFIKRDLLIPESFQEAAGIIEFLDQAGKQLLPDFLWGLNSYFDRYWKNPGLIVHLEETTRRIFHRIGTADRETFHLIIPLFGKVVHRQVFDAILLILTGSPKGTVELLQEILTIGNTLSVQQAMNLLESQLFEG